MKVKYLQEPTPEWVDPWKKSYWSNTWGFGHDEAMNYLGAVQNVVMMYDNQQWVVVNHGMNRYHFPPRAQEAQAIPDYPPNPQPEQELYVPEPDEALNRYVWRP